MESLQLSYFRSVHLVFRCFHSLCASCKTRQHRILLDPVRKNILKPNQCQAGVGSIRPGRYPKHFVVLRTSAPASGMESHTPALHAILYTHPSFASRPFLNLIMS